MAGRDFISPRFRSSNECLTYENGASFFSPLFRLPAPSPFCLATIITAPCFLDVRGIPLVTPFCSPSVFSFSHSFWPHHLPLSRAFSWIPFSLFSAALPSSPVHDSLCARFHSRSLSIHWLQVAAINKVVPCTLFLPRNCSEKSAFSVITCCSEVINFRPAGFPFTLYARRGIEWSSANKRTDENENRAAGNGSDESQIIEVNNVTRRVRCVVSDTNGNGIEAKSNDGTVPMLAKWSTRSLIILMSGGMRIYTYIAGKIWGQ